MGNLSHTSDSVAASQGDAQDMLGEFLYLSLSNLLVEKAQLSELCEGMGISCSGGTQLSVADAFHSATGDIKERKPVTVTGETNVYSTHYRGNEHTVDALLREPVKETLNQKTNRYEKLVNITCDRKDRWIYCTNIVTNPDIDVQVRYHQAEELFKLYQRRASRKQIEAVCANFLREMEATKLSVNGHLYFVPRSHMEKVDTFEDFTELLGDVNRNNTPLIVNSSYIIDDKKQRSKMAEKFHDAAKKEITEYQERCDYFIESNCQSSVVMEHWVLGMRGLEERKHHYEEVLRRRLNGLGEEFSTPKLLSQEPQVRANVIHLRKAVQKSKSLNCIGG